MILTISNAPLNITVTLLLGFIAGWHHDFDGKQATTLNRMVMLYALPLSLLAAMAGMERALLLSQGLLGFAILLGMAGGYPIMAGVCTATLGPGAINPLLSVADAQTDSAPLVAITAQVGLNRIYMESYQIVDLVSTPIRCERNEP
jgi:malonate transporter and related proteins